MSDNLKGSPKRGPSSQVEKKGRSEIMKATPQITSKAEDEDPRGKFLLFAGKKIRLIKCEHSKLPMSSIDMPDGEPALFERYACALEVETVPPNRYVRSMLYYVLWGKIRNFKYGPICRPEWNTPYEFRPGMVIDVSGGEWLIEKGSHEEVIEEALEESTASSSAGRAADTVGAAQKVTPAVKAGSGQTKQEILPGWKSGKLLLKKLPNGREPAVFMFGNETYTVPSGKAWEIVSGMIEADAYEGHGVKLPARAGDAFKKEHRRFYSEIMKTASDGKRYLRTK